MSVSTISKTESLLESIYQSQYSNQSTLNGPYGKRLLTYADYIASGQPLKMIEEFIAENVLPFYANTHTEASYTGFHTTHLREEARKIIKDSVNANDEDVLIFCGSGSTGAVDKINRLLIQISEKTKKEVFIFHGPFEHHSNILPWREGNFKTIAIQLSKEGLVDLQDLEMQLKNHQGKGILIGSFSAASNVTGIISPIDEITQLLHRYGALSFWDYAAAAPYVKIDMNAANGLHKDAVFISTHKFIGAPGSPGILIAKKNLFTNEVPVTPGGGTVHFVTRNKQRYHEDIETREEAGTPAIIESVRAGLAFKLKDEIGVEEIEKRENAAFTYLLNELGSNPNVFILGNIKVKRLAFFAFNLRCAGRFLHHGFVISLLNDLFGIQARGGCSCAGPYGHDLLEISNDESDAYINELLGGNVGLKPGWARLNLNYFIPEEEVKFIVQAVKWIAEHGFMLLKDYHFDDANGTWKNKHFKGFETHSLHDFTIEKDFSKTPHAEKLNRKAEHEKYFLQADEIVAASKLKWNDIPAQEYKYNQVQNPLRWYTLAQDIKI